jgi:hypothetical protein
VNTGTEALPDDIDTLKAALLPERAARQESEARATGAEAMVAHLKLLIAKLRHDRFGASSERGSKLLDQMELQLEELEATASEAATKAATDTASVTAFTRRKPVRAPLPGHLPRERVVIEAPSACPCCGGMLAKFGETITETLEVIPRQWKVIQTVRAWAAERTKVNLPLLREDHPATCGWFASRPNPSDCARTSRCEPAGDDPGSKIRPAPAAEPVERKLCPRGHQPGCLDAG